MEKIGLQAVLEMSSFRTATSEYLKTVSRMSAQTTSAAGSISSSFVSAGSGILKFGAIAGGVALAGVAALTGGLVLLGSTALAEFSKYERMALSIQSLVARDLAQGKQVEVQRQVLAGLTKKEAQELEGLAGKIQDEELARDTLHARIMEQSEALRQLRDAHGDEALDVRTATARLAEMTDQYNDAGVEIDNMKNRLTELTNKNGELVTVLDKVRTGQMSMNEAMTQAGPKAQELLRWISKLAILSPFTEEGINNAFQTALAYGFNIDQAKRLTQAEVDFSAATGKSVETTNLIALALGQMQAKGKVSGQEIIQLTNAGIGVNRILEGMGFNLDDVSNGLVDADTFINAVISDMEIFKGSAASQASTFSGLISTLSDLKAIGLREFFGGTFRAIQPYLADFVGGLVSATLETGRIRQLGDTIGGVVAQGLKQVAGFVSVIVSGFRVLSGQKAAVQLFTALRNLGINTGLAKQITDITRSVRELFTTLQGLFQRVQGAFQSGGILGAISEIGSMISEAWTSTIQPALATWGSNFWNWLLYDVIPAIPGQVTTLVNSISENLRTGWDFISSTLTGWGYNFFNWITQTVIPAIPEQVGKIVTAISNYLRENFPSVSATFDSVVAAINEGLTKIQGAFTRFGTKGAAISLLGQLGMDPETIGKIDTTLTSITDKITTFVSNVMLAYSRFGTEGAVFSILGQLGISSDTLVTLKTTLDEIVTGVTDFVTRIQGAFASGSKGGGVFGGLSASLKTAAGEILANIPTFLTDVVDGIGTFFRDSWPTIQKTLSEWSDKFWEWTNTIIDGAGAALAGILLAITAWSTSPEAQSSLSETGEEIGKAIHKGIAFLLENQGEATKVLLKLAGGLLAAVATITANLIIIGSQIVAGILSGILESMGIDLQPAMFSELRGILQGLAENSMTIIREVAKKIVKALADNLRSAFTTGVNLGKELREFIENIKDVLTDPEQLLEMGKGLMEGLLKGLKKNSGIVLEYLKSLVMNSIPDIFTGGWELNSPSKLTEGYGKNLIQGLTNGATGASGQLISTLSGIGQSALDTLMTGLKVTDSSFIHDFIDDLNMGGIAKAAGTGGGQWKNFRNILKNEISANMQGLADGSINFMDKITEVASRFQFPANLAREFAKQEGLVQHLTGTFAAMFQKLRIENMAASIGIANNFSSIGSSFADMIQSQIDAFEKSKEATAKLKEEGAKLTEAMGTQEGQLATLQKELAELTAGEEADTVAIEKKRLAIEKANETLAFQERQMAILQQELIELNQTDTIAIEKKQLAIQKLTEEINENTDDSAKLAQQQAQMAILQQELTELTTIDTLAIEKKQLAIDKLAEGMDSQQKQLVILQEELGRLTETSKVDTEAIEKKQTAISQLTEEIDANSKAIQANQIAIETARQKLMQSVGAEFMADATDAEKIAGELAKIQLLTEFLAGDQDQLTIASKLQTVYGEVLVEQHLDRVKAQEELIKLTAEQARREQEIIRQREAQAKLDFLGQQINLIKLISDRGLNPRDILGGITLGLQAGATDLLAATNKVVEAMVAQINADLQMGSPSRLMIKTFKQVMAGAAIGMERGQSMLSDAVRSIPILNGSIPQPVFSQAGGVGGSSSTYNYNFPMTVNTAATAPAVVRQYEIKRSMYAN